MAAIKTKGYKRRNADASEEFRPSCDPQDVSPPWMAATLVQHNGPHERVFTESEVKAMALAAIKGIHRVLPQSPEHVGRAGGEVAKALLNAGIVLDPA